jgi:hypothetical protein
VCKRSFDFAELDGEDVAPEPCGANRGLLEDERPLARRPAPAHALRSPACGSKARQRGRVGTPTAIRRSPCRDQISVCCKSRLRSIP